jgi:hypothetical protein
MIRPVRDRDQAVQPLGHVVEPRIDALHGVLQGARQRRLGRFQRLRGGVGLRRLDLEAVERVGDEIGLGGRDGGGAGGGFRLRLRGADVHPELDDGRDRAAGGEDGTPSQNVVRPKTLACREL